MSDILLATDLDGTLIGDNEAIVRLNEVVADLKATKGLQFAYITGRSKELFDGLVNEAPILAPDALVTALGTEIYMDNVKLAEWPSVPEWDAVRLREMLQNFVELELQPATEQRDYKLSYYLIDNDQLVQTIRQELADYPVDVVYSMSKYLDVMPRGINKGSALEFLADRWGISKDDVYACGDSGNDVDMLAKSKAIAVGNSKDELLSWVSLQSTGVYTARSNYADGIIEGLRYYKIIE